MLVIFSRNIVLGLICLIMVFVAGLIFIAPANAALILAIALYVGSVFASLMAIITRKRDDLTILRMQVGDLMAAEQRRILLNVTQAGQSTTSRSSASEGVEGSASEGVEGIGSRPKRSRKAGVQKE